MEKRDASILFYMSKSALLNLFIPSQIMLSIQRQEKLRYLTEMWLHLSSRSVSMTEVTGSLAMIFGIILQMPVVPTTYPMPGTSPVPYVQDVHDIISYLIRYVPFDPSIHHPMNLAFFEVLLLFCCISKDRAKLAQYIPFVKLFPMQTLALINKGLLRSDTRIGPMLFPSCALEYWSDDSGLAGFFFRSSEKVYNLHYFETLDFISTEELTWEKDPQHVSVEFRSKSWKKKEY